MKRIGSLVWPTGVMVVWLATGQAWAQNLGVPTRGLALAQQLCSECHAITRGEARSPNVAAPPFDRIANVPGMTATALSASLQSPHRRMPNVMLNADELSNIVAYILSLQRSN